MFQEFCVKLNMNGVIYILDFFHNVSMGSKKTKFKKKHSNLIDPITMRKRFEKLKIPRQNLFYWAKTGLEFCKERDFPNSTNGVDPRIIL